MLLVLCGNTLGPWSVMTRQARLPVGKMLCEIPAGMMDGDGNFVSVAAKEIAEETGLTISQNELIDMTKLMHQQGVGEDLPGLYTSPGGSDEFVRMVACVKHVDDGVIKQLHGRSMGVANEGESITVEVVPWSNFIVSTSDAKSVAAYALFNHLELQKLFVKS
eukprot:TRINITY_DN2006_c0_g1_i2.p1 TRINITY_DN2006_c0_g1~~TRINITY_DN2006_c0_g1_i2.p1  ORF type:complete len:163 (-),score=37.98 TRINITY_DN2006_c0_g1_i2:129-617(-)